MSWTQILINIVSFCIIKWNNKKKNNGFCIIFVHAKM